MKLNEEMMKKRIKSFYDVFLAGYGHRETKCRAGVSIVNLMLKNRAEANILDAGCGTGSLTNILAKISTNSSITGIDISSESCKVAHKRNNLYKNVTFIAADLAHLPLRDSSYDFIILYEVLEHIISKERDLVMHELRRVITPSGCLLLTTPNGLHFTILIRKIIGWISKGRFQLSDQIYDNPLFVHSLTKLLKISGWKIMSFNFANYTTSTRIEVKVPKFPLFSIQIVILAFPNKI
jgi:ubiquinone/menaquinone biosynthesis C-methylase UbiE